MSTKTTQSNKKKIICDCTGTTQEKVEVLIAKGRNTVEDIASATGAGTGCGSCDVEIQEVIDNAKLPPLTPSKNVDVLCLGHACYDLAFSVDHHPKADEKMTADFLVECGGGPAANAAVMVARLGLKAAFAGYLGNDIQGECHYQELMGRDVNIALVKRGESPTPISTILAKPNGDRALINYTGATQPLRAGSIDFLSLRPKVVLFDGHQPHESLALLEQIQDKNIPTVLDAGSMNEGTKLLMDKVDYLICSEKFALQHSHSIHEALKSLSKLSPAVVITLGSRGLVWQRGDESGRLTSYEVNVVDSTGAGDAFHGAFAAALSLKMKWIPSLTYASAAGALCCTGMGARLGLPTKAEHQILFSQSSELL
ncbi:MAG: (2Fe-2S)-binding protein [Methylococcales bacterium]|nr:(2Fe-2S)-binding protein [Methylococcales bacterium]